VSFSIAPADPSDIFALQNIERAANEMFRPLGLIPFPAEGASIVSHAMHEELIGAGQSWAAYAEGEPVGFVLGIRHPDSHYLAELAVHPAFGRRGIGRALVDFYCDEAAREGASAVTLSTFRDVPWNAPFYRRMGFGDLPRAEMTSWMMQYEQNQIAAGLDIGKRLFMRKPL
jgi:GNAT superfamily N-acetyltransferase